MTHNHLIADLGINQLVSKGRQAYASYFNDYASLQPINFMPEDASEPGEQAANDSEEDCNINPTALKRMGLFT